MIRNITIPTDIKVTYAPLQFCVGTVERLTDTQIAKFYRNDAFMADVRHAVNQFLYDQENA